VAIELAPLCTIRIQLKPPIEVGPGPAGTRMIFELANAQVQGERLARALLGTAAVDWAVLGTGTLDIGWTLRTNDGAAIFVQYHGRRDASQGLHFPMTIYVAPRFEAGDQRQVRLNRIQAVGKGTVSEDLSRDCEWYEVR
jgi:Protein of unknown function (DUF3237)